MTVPASRVGMNILREEEAEREVTPVIPKEVQDAIAVLQKYTADPEKLAKLKMKRETAVAQHEEAKEKVEEFDKKIDEIDAEIAQLEKNMEKMDELNDVIKDIA